MVTVNEAVLARYERSGKKFELLVDSEKARKYRNDPDSVSLDDVVAARNVFSDGRKGTKAPDEDLEEAFETTNFEDIAKVILKKGSIQLTTEQRKKMQEDKRKKIISLVVRRTSDPEGRPHPPQRIENAINEAGIHIDPLETAEGQLKKIIDAIRPLIPISTEDVTIEVMIPSKHAGSAYGIAKEFGTTKSEEWGDDGSLTIKIEMPAGMQSEFYDKLNSVTHGEAQTKIIKK